MKDRAPLQSALLHPNVVAFGQTVDLGEHGRNADSPDRYRELYGGALFDAPPWVHPHQKVKAAGIVSTAAGRGQFLAGTWDGLAEEYGFPDFSPECQDEAMVALYIRRGALEDIVKGRFESAIQKCAHEWASLPGSPYGQPTLTMEAARARYLERGGQLAEAVSEQPVTEPEQEASQVDPLTALSLIGSIGPAIINLIPQVKKLFDPAVPVAERNVGAAVAVLQTITDVAKTPDVHSAVAAMKSDPQLRQNVIDAVVTHPELVGLLEIGGGIQEARKANQAAAEVTLLRDRALIIGLVFMVGVFMLLVDVFYVHPAQYDGNLRTQIVTGVLGLAAMVGAYFLGSSLGSQRKTDIIATSPAKE